jgi:tRNA(Ile)-lysidine synthase
LVREGLGAGRLADTAGRLARARAALDDAVAALLAQSVTPDPAGFAWLDPGPWAAAPAETRLRALAGMLTMVGGADYAPRFESLDRLADRLSAGLRRGVTLGGCRILPARGRRDRRLLLVREAKTAEIQAIRPGETLLWDGRFELKLGRGRAPAGGLRLGPLGEAGWARVLIDGRAPRDVPIPPPARLALPALFDRCGLLESPLLGYLRPGEKVGRLRLCRFAPRNAMAPAGFTVA